MITASPIARCPSFNASPCSVRPGYRSRSGTNRQELRAFALVRLVCGERWLCHRTIHSLGWMRHFLHYFCSRLVPAQTLAGTSLVTEFNRPVIRIASVSSLLNVLSFSQPTIVPPPTPVGDAVKASYPTTAIVRFSGLARDDSPDDQKKRKITKRRGPRLRPINRHEEHPCGREWQLSNNRSANPVILHGYYFWQLVRNLFT